MESCMYHPKATLTIAKSKRTMIGSHLATENKLEMVSTYLPLAGTLARELGKDYGLARVFLLVLLSACLHEEGIPRHLPLRLSVFLPHPF